MSAPHKSNDTDRISHGRINSITRTRRKQRMVVAQKQQLPAGEDSSFASLAKLTGEVEKQSRVDNVPHRRGYKTRTISYYFAQRCNGRPRGFPQATKGSHLQLQGVTTTGRDRGEWSLPEFRRHCECGFSKDERVVGIRTEKL
jgi:hypothetical protein